MRAENLYGIVAAVRELQIRTTAERIPSRRATSPEITGNFPLWIIGGAGKAGKCTQPEPNQAGAGLINNKRQNPPNRACGCKTDCERRSTLGGKKCQVRPRRAGARERRWL